MFGKAQQECPALQQPGQRASAGGITQLARPMIPGLLVCLRHAVIIAGHGGGYRDIRA